jgi:hypothetical protein
MVTVQGGCSGFFAVFDATLLWQRLPEACLLRNVVAPPFSRSGLPET